MQLYRIFTLFNLFGIILGIPLAKKVVLNKKVLKKKAFAKKYPHKVNLNTNQIAKKVFRKKHAFAKEHQRENIIAPILIAKHVLEKNCTDHPDWRDSFDDGCQYYADYGCGGATNYAKADGISAYEACCVCHSKSFVTLTSSPTSSPTQIVPNCVDNENWTDKYGDGCSLYVDNGCHNAEDFANNYGISAKEACCVCKTTTIGPNCKNIEGWSDSLNKSCDYYVDVGCDGAEFWGNDDEVTAYEACCTCQSNQNSTPKSFGLTFNQNKENSPNCVNLEWWVDSSNYGCEHYDKHGCDGAESHGNEDGITAYEACCTCQSNQNSLIKSLSLTFNQNEAKIPDCVNLEGWVDSSNYGCEHYDNHGCDGAENRANDDGINAYEACCACNFFS